ncbi:hypothetical protein BDA99DRAFT_317361 [Phascolomyces articulosus]|uniref:Uncharacterized protein n=1 Tax=Phascolomyces articulosus TaxID=60185 RepID=A0AAD5JLJ2_9FUNG|nr:hypothetical protein BDA99DRAFT_317361 [Phascolomyces articulosus]
MQQMEDDAHCLSKKVKRQNKNDHDSNVKYENRVHDATQAMAIYKSLVSTTATTTEGQQKQPFGWELTIKDGLLELNSDIDTIEELLQYSNSFIKHLSPFRGVFQKSSIYLETTSFNLLIRTFRFIFLSIENLASKRSSQQCNLLSVPQQQQQQHQHNYHHYVQREHQQQISIQHPSIPYLHLHYRSIVDHLIHIYSNHENSRRLFLHVPTFLNYYQHLQDPLTCPITLAVCVHTLCTARRMITHSASERRAIANFFYDKCKDILYDIFDDPDYKLETIIVINLLQHFVMFVLLRFNEARRWITIAHCLCKNLESNNMTDEGVTQPHHQHQPKKCQQLTLYLPSDIKHALLQRHIFYTENTYQLLDFIVDETASGPHPRKMNSMKVSYMQSIPGEDRGTCEMIEAHNRLLQLCTNPYMAAISAVHLIILKFLWIFWFGWILLYVNGGMIFLDIYEYVMISTLKTQWMPLKQTNLYQKH